MLSVWKFPLTYDIRQKITAPGLGKVVLTAKQNDRLTVWVEVDEDAPEMSVMVWVVGTGHRRPVTEVEGDVWIHIGSILDGSFVWHLYATDVRNLRWTDARL